MSKKVLRVTLSVLLLLLFVRPAGAIVLGQLDDFQNGTRMNWLNGASAVALINSGGPAGVNDAYIQVTANGSGPGGLFCFGVLGQLMCGAHPLVRLRVTLYQGRQLTP